MNRKSNDLMATFKKMAGAIGVAFGVQQLLSFGKELFALGAKAEGIRNAFDRLDDPTLLSNLRRATRGTVDDLTLMTAAVQANNFRISLKQLPTYFEFAQQRARATGESVDYLVDSIVRGIGRKSALVLDNLGISLSDLNEQLAKTPDYADAVGAIIQREMAKAGEYTETAADQADKLATAWKNLKLEMSDSSWVKGLAGQMSKIAENFAIMQDKQLKFARKLELLEMPVGSYAKVREVMDQMYGSAYAKDTGLKPVQQEVIKTIGDLKEELKSLEAAYDTLAVADTAGIKAHLQRTQALKDEIKALSELNKPGVPSPQYETGIAVAGWAANPASLSQVENYNKLSIILQENTEKMYDLYGISMMLEGTFTNLFSAGIQGWDEFGKAAVAAIQQMLVKLAALATTYAILSMIPGFSGFMEAVGGFTGFVGQGFGINPATVSTKPSASAGTTILKGRDIAWAGNRYENILLGNT